MGLTRDYRKSLEEKLGRDKEYAPALLAQAIEMQVAAEDKFDLIASRLLLRDLVNGTVGFARLAKEVPINDKSLHRILSQEGNPTTANMQAILTAIKKLLHVKVEVKTTVVRQAEDEYVCAHG